MSKEFFTSIPSCGTRPRPFLPGLITRDFLDGRRARYVPPARLYIFVSVVFFFLIGKFVDYRMEGSHEGAGSSTGLRATLSVKDLLSFTVKDADSLLMANDLAEVAQASVRVRLNEEALAEVVRQLKTAPDRRLDSLLRAEKAEPTRWNRLFVRQAGKLVNFSDAATQHSLVHATLKYRSTVMFILMPFVAFLLLGLYYRRGHYYAEHLVFSVHLHAVIFLFQTVALLVTFLISSGWTDRIRLWSLLVYWLYFLLSFKRVYRQSWMKTTLKFLLLLFMYPIVAGMFMVAVILAGVLTF